MVGEGSEIVLSSHEWSASDGDVPTDKLVISVETAPKHGTLSLVVTSSSEQVMIEVPMREVTVDELLVSPLISVSAETHLLLLPINF